MNELIKITAVTINHETVNAVNARDLWRFLESKQDFSNWIKSRIRKYGFKKDIDFTVNKIVNGRKQGKDDSINLSNQTRRGGDRRSIDYIISLDMAKELAMVENNEQGRKIRQYFIEVEKQYREWEKAARKFEPEPDRPEFDDGDPDIFIEKAYYMNQRILPTWLLAARLGISPELLRILSNSNAAGLIDGEDIFRLRNVTDRFINSMKKVGFPVHGEWRNVNLYTPSGADKIIEVLKQTGVVERERMIANHRS